MAGRRNEAGLKQQRIVQRLHSKIWTWGGVGSGKEDKRQMLILLLMKLDKNGTVFLFPYVRGKGPKHVL